MLAYQHEAHIPSDNSSCRLGRAADSTTIVVLYHLQGASFSSAGAFSVPQKPNYSHRTTHASHDYYCMGAAVGTALQIIS